MMRTEIVSVKYLNSWLIRWKGHRKVISVVPHVYETSFGVMTLTHVLVVFEEK